MKFLKLRAKLINWLAKDDIAVIINTTVYDAVLEANSKLSPNCLFKRNKSVNFDNVMETEIAQRLDYRTQGIRKSGNGLVLDPSLL